MSTDEILHEAFLWPRKIRSVVEKTGLSKLVVQRYVAKMRKEGEMYIARWHGTRERSYRIGKFPDAKKPPKQTNAEIRRRYHSRRMKDPEYRIENCRRARAWYYRKKHEKQAPTDMFLSQFAGIFGKTKKENQDGINQ